MFAGTTTLTPLFKSGDVVKNGRDTSQIGVVRESVEEWYPGPQYAKKRLIIKYFVYPFDQIKFNYKGYLYTTVTEQSMYIKSMPDTTYALSVLNGEELKRQWAIIYYIKKTRLIGKHLAEDKINVGTPLTETELNTYIKAANVTSSELASIKFDTWFWNHPTIDPKLSPYRPFQVVKGNGFFGVVMGISRVWSVGAKDLIEHSVRILDGSMIEVEKKGISIPTNTETIRQQVLYVLGLEEAGLFSSLTTEAKKKLNTFQELTSTEMNALKALTTGTVTSAIGTSSPLVQAGTTDTGIGVGKMVIIYDSKSKQQMLARVDSFNIAKEPKLPAGVQFGLILLGGGAGLLATALTGLFSDPAPSYGIYVVTLLTGNQAGAIISKGKWQGEVSLSPINDYVAGRINSQFKIVQSMYSMFGSTPEIEAAGKILSQGQALTDGQLASVKKPLTDIINSQLGIIKNIKASVKTTGTGLIDTYEAKLLRGEFLTQAEGKYLEDTWTSFVTSSTQYAQVITSIPAMISTPITPPTSVVPIVNIASSLQRPIVSIPQIAGMTIAPELIYAGIGLALFILIW